MKRKISIITVCYNSASTIEDTIKSVLAQKYDNYEYLIIDGLSKDNTLDIVKKYESKFKGKMKIISEKDKGLYDAMNKGIKLATGDIIGIINSDDVLIDEHVFEKINSSYTDETDILYANLIYCDSTLTHPIRDYISGKRKKNEWCPAHPTMYIKRSVFDKVGLYNLNYKVSSDYDMMVRINKGNFNFTYLNDYLVLMRLGGVSNGLKGYVNNFKDAYRILKDNNISLPFLRTLKRSIKTVFQYLRTYFNKPKIDLTNNK